MQCVWGEFLELAKQEIGTQSTEAWLKCVSVESVDRSGGEVRLLTPNEFVAGWISRNYCKIIKTGLSRLLQISEPKIKISSVKSGNTIKNWPVSEKEEKSDSAVVSPVLVEGAKLESRRSIIRGPVPARKTQIERYTFESFIVGPSNHMAYSACRAIARGFVRGYNPLFVYGKTGLGKTHLVSCVAHEAKKNNPAIRIACKSTDKFVDEFIKSIKADRMEEFKQKYSSMDLLILDDIQFLAKKEQTQEAFFHIFNSMYERGRQIVLTSDTAPSQIGGFHERLRSRFVSGLTVDVQAPDFETRVAILEKKAEDMGLAVTREVSGAIAARVLANIRELEGALIKIHTAAILAGCIPSLELVERILGAAAEDDFDQIKGCPSRIIKQVGKSFDISVTSLRDGGRGRATVVARKVAAHLLRVNTELSLKEIGQLLGGKSHSTILHSCESIGLELKKDLELAAKVSEIQAQIQ